MAISKNSMRAHTPSHVSTTRSSLLCSKLSNCSSSPRKNAKTDSEYPKRTPPKTVQLPADCKQSKWCSASPRSSILFPNYLQKLKGKRNEETQQLNGIAQGPMYELLSLLLLLMMTMNTFHSLSLQQSKIAPLLSLPGGGQDCLQLTAIPQEKPYSS